MKKLRVLLTVLSVALLSVALCACGGVKTAESVEGKTYVATAVQMSWTSTATAEQKAAVVEMVKTITNDDTVTEANALTKFSEQMNEMLGEQSSTMAFKANGVVELGADSSTETATWTQKGDTVRVTQASAESMVISLKVSGDTLTASASDIMSDMGSAEMFAGVDMKMVFTEVK